MDTASINMGVCVCVHAYMCVYYTVACCILSHFQFNNMSHKLVYTFQLISLFWFETIFGNFTETRETDDFRIMLNM